MRPPQGGDGADRIPAVPRHGRANGEFACEMREDQVGQPAHHRTHMVLRTIKRYGTFLILY